jgi:hypothetical protein
VAEDYFDEEKALAELLLDNVLFCNERKYVCFDDKTIKEPTVVLFVNINDTFVLAADATALTLVELPRLYKFWQENKGLGVAKWAALKLNLQPRKLFVEGMKEEGLWDEKMEALRENKF